MQGSASLEIAPALTAQGVACRRGDRLLFRGLGFALESGEALHLTGANGMGKTTLIRALAGLTTPYAGTIECHGAVGLLDERPALDPDLPLGKALSFWNRIDALDNPTATLALLGLEPLIEVPVRYLSTGQRKRASFAVLIGRNVPVWLLDEPLSGLDVAAIDQVTALIQSHVDDGGIALIASHQTLKIDGLRTLELSDFAAPISDGDEE